MNPTYSLHHTMADIVYPNDSRNGSIPQFEAFQEAVMPFLLERAQSKKLTEGEMRAMFDEIDTER